MNARKWRKSARAAWFTNVMALAALIHADGPTVIYVVVLVIVSFNFVVSLFLGADSSVDEDRRQMRKLQYRNPYGERDQP